MNIHCPNCNTEQPDNGKGQTCDECGWSPLPSYAYPKSHAFYPKPAKPPKPPIQAPVYKRRTALPTQPTLDGRIGPNLG